MVAGDGLGVEQAAQDAFLHTLGHRPEQRVDSIIVEHLHGQEGFVRVMRHPVGRGKGQNDLTRTVAAGTAGAGKSHQRPMAEPPQLALTQGDICCQHRDDGALVFVGRDLLLQQLPDVDMIITAIGFPFTFGYYAVCGILRGMGESKRPLIFILIAAGINIVLDILLVAAFKMEAAGTAIATTLAQFGSFAAAFVFMLKKKEKFDFELKLSYFKFDKEALGVIIKLGIPQVVRSLLVRMSMLWVNANANSFGLTVSATNSVGNKLQKFLEVFVQGVDTASSSMVGQNLGAKKPDRAGKVTLCTLCATLTCAAVTCMICIFLPKQVFGLFTNDTAVIELCVTFLHIFILHFIVSAIIGAFQAMVMGCGFVELGFLIGILDGVVCKIGLSWLFMNVFQMGYQGLWWGVACSRIIPTIICIAYYCSGKWRTRTLLKEPKKA